MRVWESFVVHWPAEIPSSYRGSVSNDPAHLIDLMPTFVAAAGTDYPRLFEGHEIQPMEGISLLPALQGESLSRDAPLGFEHHGNLALRDGRWKIVSTYRKNQPAQSELYDMQADRTELHDVSEEHPDKKQELIDKWQVWAHRIGVQPWPIKPKR